MPRIPIVVFAQTPPPEHGQSRMVQLALNSLRDYPEHFDIHHVNARFSDTIEEIGSSTFGKGFRMLGYLWQLISLRMKLEDPLLYYVPGPVKWSAVIRDWVLLGVLRIFYQKTVFHWHAIGQGEWAHGSERLALSGPTWIHCIARIISRLVLARPYASISVSPTSRADSVAVYSEREFTVCNGIKDPCPDYDSSIAPSRAAALAAMMASGNPHFRILYLSHGTAEKGLLDAVGTLRAAVTHADPAWRFSLTFAGGVSESISECFEQALQELKEHTSERLQIHQVGYVVGEQKSCCYREHDIYLAPSHWESFGLTVVEAMAHGMQVVAAASDGVRGVLSEEYPYLAPPASCIALSERLLECCTDMIAPTLVVDGRMLRQRFLDLFQLKDFTCNLSNIMFDLGGTAVPLREAMVQATTQAARGQRVGNVSNAPTLVDRRYNDIALPVSELCALGESAPLCGISASPISLSVYLADQNPGFDRSIGISRMTQSVVGALKRTGKVSLLSVSSCSSQAMPWNCDANMVLPWNTRSKWVRFLTDHLHPLLPRDGAEPDVYYYPKGYLPWFSKRCSPSVVTIHDTIIQHDKDHYPNWRSRSEYGYWSWALRHTLREADRIMTVSEHSRDMILSFMVRHNLPEREITVTYEPCFYESYEQPVDPPKGDYVLHLSSREPHKRSNDLIRWWAARSHADCNLTVLELVGNLPPESRDMIASHSCFRHRPFMDDESLRNTIAGARALILPSEIEGFGLPAIEAYYLGTPVCFTKGTSIEEILEQSTATGGFDLDAPESLWPALADVLAMPAGEVRRIGLELRERFASEKIVGRMLDVFRKAACTR